MDNKFSGGHNNKENLKDSISSTEKRSLSSVKDHQQVDSTIAKTLDEGVYSSEKVAEKIDDSKKLKTSLYVSRENVPSPYRKNVHIGDLVHVSKNRKNIKRQYIKKLAEEKFKENGQGITYIDVMKRFFADKKKAQRTLKNLHTKKFCFTAKDLTKQSINLKGIKRENPQRYYLTDMKSKIIESRKKNVQIDTTEVGLSQRPSSLTTTIDQVKSSNLQELLSRLSSSILYIHKLQIWTCIPSKYYDELAINPADPVNKAKIYETRIDQSRGMPGVKFIISSNSTVMVSIVNSEHTFSLSTDQEVSDLLVFLDMVQ